MVKVKVTISELTAWILGYLQSAADTQVTADDLTKVMYVYSADDDDDWQPTAVTDVIITIIIACFTF